MYVSNYKATFSPIHLVFLELDTHRNHLDFKTLDENNNEVIPRILYLQLLNKDHEYIQQWKQNLPRFKPHGTTRATDMSIKKINWNWGIFSWWNWAPQARGKKKEMIKYNHRHHRHRLNYLSSDCWRGLYPSICQQCWPTHWGCLGWAWGSSFTFSGCHVKIFQGPNKENMMPLCCLPRAS